MDLPTYLSTNNELTMRAQQCARRSDGANARQAKKQRNTYGMYLSLIHISEPTRPY